MFSFSLEKMDVDEALKYFERLDNGDVSDVCAPSSEDEFVSSDSSVTPESSVGNIPSGGAENIPHADDDGFSLLKTTSVIAMSRTITLLIIARKECKIPV